MASAKPWFWERLHSAAAEHAALALEWKVPANSRPALDWQVGRPHHPGKTLSTHVPRDDLLKAMSTMSPVKGKESNKVDRLGKSLSLTQLPGSNHAKPSPPAPITAHRPDVPAPTRFQPQALGIVPQKEKRIPDFQQASSERPKNHLMQSQNSLERPGRSQSCATLSNFRVEKNMKETRSLLTALVNPPSCELREDISDPLHMHRIRQLGDRMQSGGVEADVRQLLSKTASFHKAKPDICAASTQPGSLATSLSGSSKSSPRLGSKHVFA